MSNVINVAQAKAQFADWMNRVAYQGQRVVVERHGKQVMAWVSMEDLARLEAMGDRQNVRQQRLAALALAEEARAQIRAERHGQLMPDSAELLNDLREGRVDDADMR
jgi:prevent-host-death family protein